MSVINREDAIAELMSLLPKLERGLIHWTGVKAMLEALPEIKTDEDTISRQAAIDAVKKNTFRLTFAEEQNCEGHVAWSANAVYSDVMEGALLELPSAQPERKTGRWIFAERKRLVDETDDGAVYRTEKWWSCSECGYAKGYQTSKPSSNYCEKCGAKMKEVADWDDITFCMNVVKDMSKKSQEGDEE